MHLRFHIRDFIISGCIREYAEARRLRSWFLKYIRGPGPGIPPS